MSKFDINGQRTIVTNEYIEVGGKKYQLPEYLKSEYQNIKIIGKKITINGYTFNPQNGTFTNSSFFTRLLNFLGF